MKLKSGVTACLLLLTGCQAGGPVTPEDTGAMPYGKWGFAFFTPRALPADVTYVAMIDAKQVLYTWHTLDSVQENPESVNVWSKRVGRYTQFNKARHPPEEILFCWDSTIDRKTYETHIIFPEAMRQKMLTPAGTDRFGNTTWYDTVLFGLAPQGKVRIWLQNNAGDNLPVEPEKITTLSGEALDVCKSIPARIDFSYSIPDGYDAFIKEFIKGKTYPYGDW
ncbi:DUF2931 family protein [[Erwinia] mediterraneensis]|uniref:DUF2931 family protein n=1 Tax=[Erwinia] mediterraneensis TaxID=2161819 RepID=UPI001030D9AD|nr:DUF2931 family protein [[Erwinia] mediterraneensis]